MAASTRISPLAPAQRIPRPGAGVGGGRRLGGACRGQRRLSLGNGAGRGHLDDLVERQVQQIASSLGVDQDLRCARQDLLHHVQIEPVARHLGRLVVLDQYLPEPGSLAFGIGDNALTVTVGFLGQPRGRTARFRNDIVEIRLPFVLLPLEVLLGAHGVVERRLHLLGGLRVLHGHLADRDAGLVAVEDLLHQGLCRHRDLLASLVEHEVHLALADDFPERAFGGLEHRLLRPAVGEQILHGVLQDVLDRELDVGDVLVVRERERLAQHLGLDVVAIADLDRTHAGQIDDLVALDRIRDAPVQPGGRDLREFSESEHHAALAFDDDVEAARQPSDEHDEENEPGASAELAHVRRLARVRASAARPLAEQAAQLAVEVAPHLVEIRRSLVAAAASFAPLWVVQ
jgi:hypothetical protein